jgi:hypothetical protein
VICSTSLLPFAFAVNNDQIKIDAMESLLEEKDDSTWEIKNAPFGALDQNKKKWVLSPIVLGFASFGFGFKSGWIRLVWHI